MEDAEQVGRPFGAGEDGLGLRRPRLVLQLGTIEAVQPPQPTEAQGAVGDVDVGVAELELTAEELEHLVAHLPVDLEPDDAPELRTPAQDELHRLEEVLGVVGQLEVGVTRDSEGVVGDGLHTWEEAVEVRRDHLLERNEPLGVG